MHKHLDHPPRYAWVVRTLEDGAWCVHDDRFSLREDALERALELNNRCPTLVKVVRTIVFRKRSFHRDFGRFVTLCGDAERVPSIKNVRPEQEIIYRHVQKQIAAKRLTRSHDHRQPPAQ